ncbi:TPA: recombinase family protein [Vibrio vulnificus]|uniref:recombinase family protein n=1 Tax=Vibrio vulnificus TaxID=672 RepID=UPI0028929FCC|nr:recombinase family protein [Vibrio vulnificus]WNJ72080.1 recombinase family protein [Vibrio vulnificus]
MSRIFAYCRVSTIEQTVENQILEIRKTYDVADHRVVSETVSGGVMAMSRKEFSNLVTNKMESGDTLVVLKIDRLGRDNIDVQQTINLLTEKGIKVVSMDLPVSDLTSAEGKMMLQIFTAFAEFEKNRIKERTKEGLDRAIKEGKELGRPTAHDTFKKVQECKEQGLSQAKTAEKLGVSVPTVKRHWNKLFSNRKEK